jgi:hypothetical protein
VESDSGSEFDMDLEGPGHVIQADLPACHQEKILRTVDGASVSSMAVQVAQAANETDATVALPTHGWFISLGREAIDQAQYPRPAFR